MFCFGLIIDGEFNFIQAGGVVYTYTTEAEARSYFDCIQHHAHLYQIDSDLSVARLIAHGDLLYPPTTILLNDEHKLALWTSYRYKSLLDWNPTPEEVQCEGSEKRR